MIPLVEKFWIPVLAALVVSVAAVNPMGFNRNQRISGTVALIAIAYFLKYTFSPTKELSASIPDTTNPTAPVGALATIPEAGAAPGATVFSQHSTGTNAQNNQATGNMTVINGATPEDVGRTVAAYQSNKEKMQYGDDLASEFSLGYSLFRLTPPNKIEPLRAPDGIPLNVLWDEGSYETLKDAEGEKVKILLPDIAIADFPIVVDCSLILPRREWAGASFQMDSRDPSGIADLNLEAHGDISLPFMKVPTPNMVLTVQIRRIFGEGVVVLVGLKPFNATAQPRTYPLPDIPKPIQLADGRIRIGPFITGEPIQLKALVREAFDEQKSKQYKEAFATATAFIKMIRRSDEQQTGAVKGFLSRTIYAYNFTLAACCASGVDEHTQAVEWAETALKYESGPEQTRALVVPLFELRRTKEAAKILGDAVSRSGSDLAALRTLLQSVHFSDSTKTADWAALLRSTGVLPN